MTLPISYSPFREVFGFSDSRKQFSHFLHTIFYQLDEQQVFKEMDRILEDPKKTDPQIYQALHEKVDQMKKPFSAWHQLKALSVLQKGMGKQSARLLKDFRPSEFHNYAEVYFKRHLKTIQKTAKLPLDGIVFSISDHPSNGNFKERLEASSLFRSYPYRNHVPLNDVNCQNPETEPEKTYRPLGQEIPNDSLDLVSVLGGLHHTPPAKVKPFIDSLRTKLRPGGVVLFRDHDAVNDKLKAMISVVHSFVNAANKVPLKIEQSEVREFKPLAHWIESMKQCGFIPISKEKLILQDDPTQNSMIAFARNPNNLKELQAAAKFRKDSVRSPDGTRATWIEWGNVRYAKQFAEFIQSKHAYAFDYLGHLSQHWKYFTTYLKESKKDLSLGKIIFSDNFQMNAFILGATAFQCINGFLNSLPNAFVARLTKGVNWRKATDLTGLEKKQAQIEQEYSNFIDQTPFYMFPYLGKIGDLWNAVWNSNESVWIKGISYVSALSSTIGLLFKAAICAPIRMMYTQNGEFIEPDKIGILVHDRQNQFTTGSRPINGRDSHPIEVVYQTPDHYKLVLVPRYRVFTELCKELASSNNRTKLLEIGSQEKITVDVLYGKEDSTLVPEGAKLLYEMNRLQDDSQRRYATYEVNVGDLAAFIQKVGADKIEYVHE